MSTKARSTRQRKLFHVLCLTLTCLTITGAAEAGKIQWHHATVFTEAQPQAELATSLELLAAPDAPRHVVVQFAEPVTPQQRAGLEAAGVNLLTYLGDNAFFATLSTARLDAQSAATIGNVSAVLAIDRPWKLHPDLEADIVHDWMIVPDAKTTEASKVEGPVDQNDPIVGVYILFHRDVDLERVGKPLVSDHGGQVRSTLESINGLVVELPASQIKPLAERDAVQWIEPPLPRFEPVNADNRLRTGADVVQDPPYGLDGSGIDVLVYDGGTVRATHQDFEGRATVYDTSGMSDHATHVAGTVGGAGVVTYNNRGMAPGVTIVSYGYEQEGGLQQGFLYTDPGDIEDDYFEAINSHGADISNNSIGTNTAPNGFPCDWEGNYGATGQLIDTIVRGDGSNPLFSQPFRIVWANGNERSSGRCGTTYHTTAPPACAKNHITVGALVAETDAMSTFSSWGPADDGRLKPDVSAPGVDVTSCSSSGDSSYTTKSGTSMASPTVCGLAALLLQDYRVQYASEPDPRNSTLKTLFAHTAVDLGNTGPDYQFGYGSVRIQPAIDLMRSGNWLEGEAAHGEVVSVLVIVNPGETEVKVTLAWDDVPGATNTIPELVNDLDLRVFDSSNTQYYPWTLGGLANPSAPAVRTEANHLDNIEQVVIDAPAPGAYRIEVYGFNVPDGPQSFSLTATPMLVACSPQGVISLDRGKYACSSTATLQVVDCDLNTDDGSIQTVSVTIASDSEPAGETVLLVETAPEAATFRGTIQLTEAGGTGILQVADGNTVTATYIDADDGQGGTNVTVDTSASVDCSAPIISNVAAADVEPRSAGVTFQTDETANGVVHYGTSCAALNEEATEVGFKTDHNLAISGLDDGTTYFFAVEAEDEAGNSASDNNGGTCYTFATPEIPDFFTEEFGSGMDLDNMTMTFAPNGSYDYYEGCVEPADALPTDPAGGTTVSLTDDTFATASVTGGASVLLYGTSFTTFYIGSNGYVTFGSGDSDYNESLEEHFEQPRVAGVYDDLNPSDGGTVSYKQLADRVAITWEDVPEYNTSNQNTFQIELFFDGTIAITHLDVACNDGIVGLSEGDGLSPDFYNSDLSELGPCGDKPPVARDSALSTPVSTDVLIDLQADDDGMPDPPAAMTYSVTSLPGHGQLSDTGAGLIDSVPYTLAGGGNQVLYSPDPGYHSVDTFRFTANDGGAPPEGGESNEAVVAVTVGGSDWDPVAFDVNTATPVNVAATIVLAATDPNGDSLTYIVQSLPTNGWLIDPSNGVIDTVPYELLAGATVFYQPPCGQTLSDGFTFAARDATWTSNTANVAITVTAADPRQVYSWTLNTDPGWSTDGQWAHGEPTGGGTHEGDPDSGYTGRNVYGYNLAGDYYSNMPVHYLTTDAIDCGNLTQSSLRFRRWLGVESSPIYDFDHATLEISDDGDRWNTVWENTGDSIDDGAWVAQQYDISSWADGASTMYLRWGMGPTDPGVTYCGWNIDDIEIWAIVPVVAADFTGDGNVTLEDFETLDGCLTGPDGGVGVGCLCVDLDADGDIDLGDFAEFQQGFGDQS